MPNEFLSPEGNLENHFVTDYWLIDQYVGDTLWTWAAASSGALGNASTTSKSTPVTTFAGGTNWKQVVCGNAYTVAIKTDGTLWIWGSGGSGLLGNAQTTNRSTPVTTFAGGTNWKQVSSGGLHTAAIKTDGTLWTWGIGLNARLGNAQTTSSISTPVTTFAGGTNWRQVSAGSAHTSAIKTDGTLWIWGNGTTGQLGNAQTTDASTPVTTFAGGNDWKQVSAGVRCTTAIKTDGTLWIWGQGSGGALGNAQTINSSTPVTTFAGGNDWDKVSCGNYYTAAIKTDGTLWTWGFSSDGCLGTASSGVTISTPVTTFTGGNDWKHIEAGVFHVAAIKTDGTLWTWGNGVDGKLGNGTTTGNTSTPITTFAGGTNWKQAASGFYHTAAVQSGINAEYPLS
jgi:alpha-tubulin suppressor-like RCC1 family protein